LWSPRGTTIFQGQLRPRETERTSSNVDLPDWLPLVSLFSLMALAMVSTAVVSTVRGRHIEGRSSWQGAAYGFARNYLPYPRMLLSGQTTDGGHT
jgi:hypothetical protein